MNKELEAVAIDYVNAVNKVGLILLKALKLTSKKDFIDYRRLHPSKKFDFNGVSHCYTFHGRMSFFKHGY